MSPGRSRSGSDRRDPHAGLPSTPVEEGVRSLSIVIPALNEEAGLGDTLDLIGAECARLVNLGEISWAELVVVDDGSTDSTGSVAEIRARETCPVRLVRHGTNRGLGAAVRSGFAAARGDLLLYTDADLPFEPHEIERAMQIQRTYRADAVVMYRLHRMGEGLRRYLYSRAYNLLVQVVLGLRVRDVNFAGKLIRRDALADLQLLSEGSFFDAELLSRLERSGSRTVQFAVDYFPRSRGRSTLSSLPVIAATVGEFVRLSPSILRAGRRSGSTTRCDG